MALVVSHGFATSTTQFLTEHSLRVIDLSGVKLLPVNVVKVLTIKLLGWAVIVGGVTDTAEAGEATATSGTASRAAAAPPSRYCRMEMRCMGLLQSLSRPLWRPCAGIRSCQRHAARG